MNTLYKMHIDCGRMGDLYATFVSTPEVIQSLIGTKVYFGEVLGKHSEVIVTMKPEHFKILTQDQDFIDKFQEYGLEAGHVPFYYIEETEETEE